MPNGVWFGPTSSAIIERPELLDAVAAETAGDSERPFAALNAAFFAGGYVLDIAPGVALDDPIEIIHLGSGTTAGSFHTRSLITLGQGSRASVLEVYAGEGRYWRNDVVAIRPAHRAELARTALREESTDALHPAQ